MCAAPSRRATRGPVLAPRVLCSEEQAARALERVGVLAAPFPPGSRGFHRLLAAHLAAFRQGNMLHVGQIKRHRKGCGYIEFTALRSWSESVRAAMLRLTTQGASSTSTDAPTTSSGAPPTTSTDAAPPNSGGGRDGDALERKKGKRLSEMKQWELYGRALIPYYGTHNRLKATVRRWFITGRLLSQPRPVILIDCALSGQQNTRETVSLVTQVSYAYGRMMHSNFPCRLGVCGIEGHDGHSSLVVDAKGTSGVDTNGDKDSQGRSDRSLPPERTVSSTGAGTGTVGAGDKSGLEQYPERPYRPTFAEVWRYKWDRMHPRSPLMDVTGGDMVGSWIKFHRARTNQTSSGDVVDGGNGGDATKRANPAVSSRSVFHRRRLVYLCAEATVPLGRIDPRAVYVVGGLVDRNRRKGGSYAEVEHMMAPESKAGCFDEQGDCWEMQGRAGSPGWRVERRRLPLDVYLTGGTRMVVTTNQCVEMLQFAYERQCLARLPSPEDHVDGTAGNNISGVGHSTDNNNAGATGGVSRASDACRAGEVSVTSDVSGVDLSGVVGSKRGVEPSVSGTRSIPSVKRRVVGDGVCASTADVSDPTANTDKQKIEKNTDSQDHKISSEGGCGGGVGASADEDWKIAPPRARDWRTGAPLWPALAVRRHTAVADVNPLGLFEMHPSGSSVGEGSAGTASEVGHAASGVGRAGEEQPSDSAGGVGQSAGQQTCADEGTGTSLPEPPWGEVVLSIVPKRWGWRLKEKTA